MNDKPLADRLDKGLALLWDLEQRQQMGQQYVAYLAHFINLLCAYEQEQSRTYIRNGS